MPPSPPPPRFKRETRRPVPKPTYEELERMYLRARSDFYELYFLNERMDIADANLEAQDRVIWFGLGVLSVALVVLLYQIFK